MKKEELEKEAKEKYHSHKTIDFQGFYNHHYYYLGYVESAEPREERIAALEKENTDLKNRNQELLGSCEGATMMYKDLQKATGIIKELLHALKNEDSDYTFALKSTHPVLVEAEQFINEV